MPSNPRLSEIEMNGVVLGAMMILNDPGIASSDPRMLARALVQLHEDLEAARKEIDDLRENT